MTEMTDRAINEGGEMMDDRDSLTIRSTDSDDSEIEEMFFGPEPGWNFLEGEKRLIAEQIRLAIRERKPKDFEWVNEEYLPGEEEPFLSFRNCCEILELDYRKAQKAVSRIMLAKKKVISAAPVAMPGMTYSHAFGECTKDGGRRDDCRECKQRTNYGYKQRSRKGREAA